MQYCNIKCPYCTVTVVVPVRACAGHQRQEGVTLVVRHKMHPHVDRAKHSYVEIEIWLDRGAVLGRDNGDFCSEVA